MISLSAGRLKDLAKDNAVTATPISDGDRHVLPLCELSFNFGGGGGIGESLEQDDSSKKPSKGSGSGVGGGARAVPVAVVVADKNGVSIKTFGK